MFSGIPLFPEQASTLARRCGRAVFLHRRGDRVLRPPCDDCGDLLRREVPHRRSAEGGRADPRLDPAGAGLVDHSVPRHHRHLRLGAIVFFDLQRPPDQTLEIYATGKRWMWRFQHVDGQNEINELHVPVGRPVKVTFTSEDVLHSCSSPRFAPRPTRFPAATARSGSRRPRSASITFSAPSTAAPITPA